MKTHNFLSRWMLVLILSTGLACAKITKVVDDSNTYEFDNVSNGSELSQNNLNTFDDIIISSIAISENQYNLLSNLNHLSAAILKQINPNYKNVVFLGKTGAGKSTVIAGLIGQQIKVISNLSGELYLETSGNVVVGHGVNSVTQNIMAFYDDRDRITYWDCPGFFDSNGPEKDALNAVLISHLFNSIPNAHVVAVVPESDIRGRATEFKTVLKHIADSFSGHEDFSSYFSLVLTQQERIKDLPSFFQNLSNQYVGDQNVGILLKNIVTNADDIVSAFPYPDDVSLYNRRYSNALFEKLQAANFGQLSCKIALTAESKEYVRDLAGNYRDQITGFILYSLSPEIVRSVRSEISQMHSNTNKSVTLKVTELREKFADYAKSLNSVSAENSLQALYGLPLESDELVENNEKLNVLQTLQGFLQDENLTLSSTWGTLLKDPIDEINRLINVRTIENTLEINRKVHKFFYTDDSMIFNKKKNKRNWVRYDVVNLEIKSRTDFGFGPQSVFEEITIDNNLYAVFKETGERDGNRFRGSSHIESLNPTPLLSLIDGKESQGY